MNIFNTIFYYPILNVLVLIYQYLPGKSFGVAIIALTILIKILLYPLNKHGLRTQKIFSKLEPKLQEIKEKFKDDKEKLMLETTRIYKEANINPFSGFLLLLVQLPILFALYRVFYTFFSVDGLNGLWGFIVDPRPINPYFLTINLALPNILLALLAGVTLFLQTKMMQPTKPKKSKKTTANSFSKSFQKQMNYFLPVFTFLILLKVCSAVSLYLIVSSIITIIQTKYVQEKKTEEN